MSVIVTFHDEGPLAKMTMNSLARCLARLGRDGVMGEVVCVLDQADARTAQTVSDAALAEGGAWSTVISSAGDPGASRNLGIGAAAYDHVLIADGDDYYSADLASAAYRMASSGKRDLVHPEYVVSFGVTNDFTQQFDQDSPLYDPDGLLTENFWTSCVAAPRRTFEEVPYPNKSEGFGFEDWWWNCRAIKMGYRHVVAPGTAMFYRRKVRGVMSQETGTRRIVAPHGLFAGDGQ